jgi:hypothetical protein
MYVMFTYVFVFAMVSLEREWEPIIIFVKAHAESELQMITSNFSVNSKPCICEMALARDSGGQGPRGDCSMKKKTEGRKYLFITNHENLRGQ